MRLTWILACHKTSAPAADRAAPVKQAAAEERSHPAVLTCSEDCQDGREHRYTVVYGPVKQESTSTCMRQRKRALRSLPPESAPIASREIGKEEDEDSCTPWEKSRFIWSGMQDALSSPQTGQGGSRCDDAADFQGRDMLQSGPIKFLKTRAGRREGTALIT